MGTRSEDAEQAARTEDLQAPRRRATTDARLRGQDVPLKCRKLDTPVRRITLEIGTDSERYQAGQHKTLDLT